MTKAQKVQNLIVSIDMAKELVTNALIELGFEEDVEVSIRIKGDHEDD